MLCWCRQWWLLNFKISRPSIKSFFQRIWLPGWSIPVHASRQLSRFSLVFWNVIQLGPGLDREAEPLPRCTSILPSWLFGPMEITEFRTLSGAEVGSWVPGLCYRPETERRVTQLPRSMYNQYGDSNPNHPTPMMSIKKKKKIFNMI